MMNRDLREDWGDLERGEQELMLAAMFDPELAAVVARVIVEEMRRMLRVGGGKERGWD